MYNTKQRLAFGFVIRWVHHQRLHFGVQETILLHDLRGAHRLDALSQQLQALVGSGHSFDHRHRADRIQVFRCRLINVGIFLRQQENRLFLRGQGRFDRSNRNRPAGNQRRKR